ncbi:MAG TPA: glycosyl hydrolase [Gemmatimonadaceae bacterium]|nr:glycosyl hydrolase [Gemmatimonadaceae bacterium]
MSLHSIRHRFPQRATTLARVLLALTLSSGALEAQRITYPGSITEDSVTWHGLRWRDIGIFRGGRSIAVAGSAKRPFEFWMGTTGGGVFKTSDGGNTWSAASDGYFGGTIGSIEVSMSDPDIVYVGTGEHAIRGNVSHGDGLFKTTNGGKTWSFAGLAATQQISRVRVHPTNPDVVWVAAFGHVYGPNPDRGVFKTIDGGKSWRKVLFRNDSTGAGDLVLDPSNPDILYASLWQAYRKPWALSSGGAGSSIYKSTDGGEHWTELTHNKGLPPGVLGRIGVEVSRAKPSLVWALIEADSGGLYKSDDAGATWRFVSGDHRIRERAWYYTRIMADPVDTNLIYAPNVSLMKSVDGGQHFTKLAEPHGDNHDLWIAPNDGARMIQSSDGGASVSYTRGESWTDQDYSTAQFYHVATTNHFPYRVCGAQQDNSGVCGPSRFPGGIPRSEWYDVSGEAGFVQARPDNPDITYGGDNSGFIGRLDHKTGFFRLVDVWPESPDGHPASEAKYRFQWTAPLLISPHDPNVLYAGGNRLFRTLTDGQSWTPVSPDLTRHDSATLGISGGPITSDQTTAEYYATIFALAESPMAKGEIWTGSDDGLLYLSRDNGVSWANITPKQFGDYTRVSSIEPGHFARGTAYVAVNRYQLEDMAPYIWKTTDFGKSWTRLDNGLPATEFLRVVREDPVRKGLLYAGTERGVWVSFDDGAHWKSLRRNLPIVPVHDLAIKDGDLIAATHGRGFWILDDISPLRQMNERTASAPAHLFKPKDAWRVIWGNPEELDAARPVGANPPDGALIYYSIAEAHQPVTVDILDAHHSLIRSFSSAQDSIAKADSIRGDSAMHFQTDSARRVHNDSLTKAGKQPDTTKVVYGGEEAGKGEEAEKPWPQRVPPAPRAPDKPGLNRFAWNLRYPDVQGFAGMMDILTNGPIAPAGRYWVRVHVGSWADSSSFVLKEDPRVHATPADLAAQFAFLRQIRDTVTAGTTAIITIRNVRAQLDDRLASVHGADSTSLATVAGELRDSLTSAERRLYQVHLRADEDALNYPAAVVERISALLAHVSATSARPTEQQIGVFRQFAPVLQRNLVSYKRVLATEIPKVNAKLQQLGKPPILPQAKELRPPKTVALVQ